MDMIEKFKKFIDEKIYNQLCYYKTSNYKDHGYKGVRFYLTAYAEDYEYCKHQICHFISSWDACIYVNMNPDEHDFVVEIRDAYMYVNMNPDELDFVVEIKEVL